MMNIEFIDFSSNIVIYLLLFLLIGLFLIWEIIGIIAKWNNFKIFNRFGWEAIIPLYSDFVFCKINDINYRWIIIIYLFKILICIPIIYLSAIVLI